MNGGQIVVGGGYKKGLLQFLNQRFIEFYLPVPFKDDSFCIISLTSGYSLLHSSTPIQETFRIFSLPSIFWNFIMWKYVALSPHSLTFPFTCWMVSVEKCVPSVLRNFFVFFLSLEFLLSWSFLSGYYHFLTFSFPYCHHFCYFLENIFGFVLQIFTAIFMYVIMF